jgi:amidase
MGSHDGMDAIVGSLGPITRSARDLALFAKTMLDAEPWFIEPQILEIPWKQNLVEGQHAEKPLSIAILWDDGIVLPHPPITNALRRVESALLAAGHDVIRWEPMGCHRAAWDFITKLYFLDGGEEYHELMRDTNDPPVPQTKWVMTFAPDRPVTIAELWKLNLQREKFRNELIAHWVATQKRTKSGRPIDAILCPVAPTLAPPHDTTRWWGYSSYWNLADYPGVVFPVDRHTSAMCHYPAMNHTPRNPIEKFIHEQWDPKVYDNAPVSLQLVARRLNEEKLLHTLNVVEEAIKQNNLPNGHPTK